MRAFFALMPPPSVAEALAAAAATVSLPRGRPVPVRNLHVTLAFLGRIDAAGCTACARAAATVRGEVFELSFDHAGSFERARVAWLGLAEQPAPLTALVAALRGALDAADVVYDPQPFRCHLTIARDARGVPLPQTVPPVRWPVREFALVEALSDAAGVHYEARATWPLRPVRRDETAPPPVQ